MLAHVRDGELVDFEHRGSELGQDVLHLVHQGGAAALVLVAERTSQDTQGMSYYGCDAETRDRQEHSGTRMRSKPERTWLQISLCCSRVRVHVL